MYELPISIIIDDISYKIRNKGDYRMVLDCFNALDDKQLDNNTRVLTSLIIFYEDVSTFDDIYRLFGDNLQKAVQEMYNFFNCNRVNLGIKSHYKLLDWKNDEILIISAINNVAKKEVRAEDYIHWWTFIGYYTAIGDCPLSNIISIRSKIAKGKKLEKYESQFRRENPEYFNMRYNLDDEEADKLFNELWNKS